MKRSMPVPALPSYVIEPIWEQFVALLPERKVNHLRATTGLVYERGTLAL
jgi:hypothetical protein